MTHTHITLVGGQPIPVYLGIAYCQPDKLIYICSEQTRQEVERVQHEVDIKGDIVYFDPVNLSEIHKKTEQLAHELESHIITINISGGTKPWAFYFSQIFGGNVNATIIYVDQNNVVRNLKDYLHHTVDLDLDVRFRLYGNALTHFDSLSTYTDADYAAIKKIRELRQFNFPEFNHLTSLYSKEPDSPFVETPFGSTIEYDTERKEVEIRIYNKYHSMHSAILDSPNARKLLINSGWFELEVASLISKWDQVKEVRLNCVFPAKTNTPKNEIDLVVDTGSRVLFVECKTQIYYETDIDKFASAVKVYGGMGSKALFVTDASMRGKALEKCQDNKIMPFSLQHHSGVVKCQEALYQLLNKELYNINAK